MNKKRFQYSAPIGKEELKAAVGVIKRRELSGFYRNFLGGVEVQAFEAEFAAWLGVKHAIALNSGTSALHVALAAAEISAGDEVIVPALTFTATASAVLMVNAKPVFVDIDTATMCLDVDGVKRAITKRTKGIIPVHLFGKVAPLAEITALARKHRLIVIEDACQAPGSRHGRRMVGSVGEMGCFSFVETKNMVIGEGGMITTNSDRCAEKCRLIRNHGEAWANAKSRSYVSEILGYNFRLTEIPAAIGRVQLKKLPMFNKMRQRNAAILQSELGASQWWRTVEFKRHEVCHIFILILNDASRRDSFITALKDRGIPASPGYSRPLYDVPLFKERSKFIKCKNAEEFTKRSVWFRDIGFPSSAGDIRFLATEVKSAAEQILS